jgi:DegV family protein with EDD domain
MSYIVLTDSGCDLGTYFLDKPEHDPIGLVIRTSNIELIEDSWRTVGFKEFYDSMRNGDMPTTSQITPAMYLGYFKGALDKGLDILYLSFSSMLSGTFGSANVAAGILKESYPDRRIEIIDTKCASSGQGLLVQLALRKQSEGASFQENLEYVEKMKYHINHVATVDDLNHLRRGGRISALSATFGSMLAIKPIIHMDSEGSLKVIDKVKGRKKSLNTLYSYFEKNLDPEVGIEAFISHGDCEEDAAYIKELIEKNHSDAKVTLFPLGMAIGSHLGPNGACLFFTGKDRTTKNQQ